MKIISYSSSFVMYFMKLYKRSASFSAMNLAFPLQNWLNIFKGYWNISYNFGEKQNKNKSVNSAIQIINNMTYINFFLLPFCSLGNSAHFSSRPCSFSPDPAAPRNTGSRVGRGNETHLSKDHSTRIMFNVCLLSLVS